MDALLSLRATRDTAFIPIVHIIRKKPQLECEFFIIALYNKENHFGLPPIMRSYHRQARRTTIHYVFLFDKEHFTIMTSILKSKKYAY
nr:hypothetical protein [Porphyromonas macacae]